MSVEDFTELREAAELLQRVCHGQALDAGWWHNPHSGAPLRDNPMLFATKIALAHSELSEALEGDRKGRMDEHLPHRLAAEVELADAVIRIFDTAGGFQMNLAEAIVEKLAYNRRRADHKVAYRAAASDGKKY